MVLQVNQFNTAYTELLTLKLHNYDVKNIYNLDETSISTVETWQRKVFACKGKRQVSQM